MSIGVGKLSHQIDSILSQGGWENAIVGGVSTKSKTGTKKQSKSKRKTGSTGSTTKAKNKPTNKSKKISTKGAVKTRVKKNPVAQNNSTKKNIIGGDDKPTRRASCRLGL